MILMLFVQAVVATQAWAVPTRALARAQAWAASTTTATTTTTTTMLEALVSISPVHALPRSCSLAAATFALSS